VALPRIAVVSFPGNNCEVESLRAVKEAGMEAVFFRWNDDRAKLQGMDGYVLPGGFSYEDRGRSGMVAARDPLMESICREAEAGKAVIGNCNGAQILVESGLIPLARGLQMSLARNVIAGQPVGFLSEWIWITPGCARDRCVTSDWEGTMHLPLAHGEGRFTTRDKDLMGELRKNDQIAFQYCDEQGKISEDPEVNPNGAMGAIAGICNPAGNVVALMPHPERTENGKPYFAAMKKWIEGRKERNKRSSKSSRSSEKNSLASSNSLNSSSTPRSPVELFIDTVITNNEERTVEAAARRIEPNVRLKQLRYIPLEQEPARYLTHISHFNPNKEIAYVRRGESLFRWNHDDKREDPLEHSTVLSGFKLLRRDEPSEGACDQGICYVVKGIDEQKLCSNELLDIFGNPHASTLLKLI
jgi:phosphoribosylformylglycinamidine synthase subunit PurQ / glutaminase